MMKTLRALLALVLFSTPAFAGTGSTNYTSSGGTTFQTGTNGNSNNSATMNICDVAGTWTTILNGCATVSTYNSAPTGLALAVNAAILNSAPEGTTADAAYAGSGNATLISIAKGTYAAITSPLPNQTGAPSSFGVGGVTGLYQSNSALTNNYPLIIGCQYNASLPTVTTAFGVTEQCDVNGRQIVVGAGVAGTPAGGVTTVQGAASMTPLATNQTQVNGATLSVTNPTFAEITDGTNGAAAVKAASTAAVAGDKALVVAISPNNTPVLPSGAAVSANQTVDPCSLANKTNLPISFNGTTSTQQIALSGSTKIYICSFRVVAAGATVFNVTTGTGTNCASGTPAAIFGSLTTANGESYLANGGATYGSGNGTVGVTPAGYALCFAQTNAVYVSGNMTYVQQ